MKRYKIYGTFTLDILQEVIRLLHVYFFSMYVLFYTDFEKGRSVYKRKNRTQTIRFLAFF